MSFSLENAIVNSLPFDKPTQSRLSIDLLRSSFKDRMSKPSITSLVGVYRLPITDDLIERIIMAEWNALAPITRHPIKREIDPTTLPIRRERKRSSLSKVVLVEVLVENVPLLGFDPFEIKQATTSDIRHAFDVAFLSADGLRSLNLAGFRVAARDLPPENLVVRVTMYLRAFRINEPLLTPDRQFNDFVVTEMPDRLRTLAPYPEGD
jgi:hypothetical protein